MNAIDDAIEWAINHRFDVLMGRVDISMAEHNQVRNYARNIARDTIRRFCATNLQSNVNQSIVQAPMNKE